jgi:hypothetical protein
VLLFISGEFLGSRGKALARALAGDPHEPVSAAAIQLVRDPITRAVSYATTTLSIGVDITTC